MTEGNVLKLIPWFHLFDMTIRISECDQVLKTMVPKFDSPKPYEETLNELFEFHHTVGTYGLVDTDREFAEQFGLAISNEGMKISLENLKKMVTLMGNVTQDSPLANWFWDYTKKYFPQELSDDGNKRAALLRNDLFPHLLLSGMKTMNAENKARIVISDLKKELENLNNFSERRYEILKRNSEQKLETLRSAIETFLKEIPNKLFSALPKRKLGDYGPVNSLAEKVLKNLILNKRFAFKKLNVDVTFVDGRYTKSEESD